MYKNLRNALKKKTENSILLKILGLKDYDAFRSFLFRRSERKYKDIIEAVGLQQLTKYKIKQGDLLFSTEQFTFSVRDRDTGVSKRFSLPKNSFLMPISFVILKDMEQTLFPNISMWFTVFYNERIYHFDAIEFLNYIDIGYIKLHDLSG